MFYLIGNDIIRIHNGRSIIVGHTTPQGNIRNLMLSGISETTASVFVHSGAARLDVVQLAQRLRLINS